jgi:hypothetical protein
MSRWIMKAAAADEARARTQSTWNLAQHLGWSREKYTRHKAQPDDMDMQGLKERTNANASHYEESHPVVAL